jgi:hypothetical protein
VRHYLSVCAARVGSYLEEINWKDWFRALEENWLAFDYAGRAVGDGIAGAGLEPATPAL